MEENLNRKADQKRYAEKKEIFEESKVNITKQISSEYKNWNEESISKRQRKLSRIAKSIWSIQF